MFGITCKYFKPIFQKRKFSVFILNPKSSAQEYFSFFIISDFVD